MLETQDLSQEKQDVSQEKRDEYCKMVVSILILSSTLSCATDVSNSFVQMFDSKTLLVPHSISTQCYTCNPFKQIHVLAMSSISINERKAKGYSKVHA